MLPDSLAVIVAQKHSLVPIICILNAAPPGLASLSSPIFHCFVVHTSFSATCTALHFQYTVLLSSLHFISHVVPCPCNVLPPIFPLQNFIHFLRSSPNVTSFIKPPTRIVSYSSQFLKLSVTLYWHLLHPHGPHGLFKDAIQGRPDGSVD